MPPRNNPSFFFGQRSLISCFTSSRTISNRLAYRWCLSAQRLGYPALSYHRSVDTYGNDPYSTLHEPPRAYLQLLGTAHSTIAESCLGYLNFQQVRARPSLSQSPTPNLPFLHLQHALPQPPTHCFSNILLGLGGPRAKRSIRRARN